MRSVDPLGSRVYRAGIRLCPPGFQREFGPQMLLDFEDACGDREFIARTRTRWRFHSHMAADLVGTVLGQWIRTGLPAIALLAMAATTIVVSLAVKAASYVRFRLPDAGPTPDRDVLGLVLFTTVVLVVLMCGILFAQWPMQIRLRRPARPRRW